MTTIIDDTPVKAAALYAVPLDKIGIEPWCRGLDPLYWALRAHPSDRGWNPINVLVAYRRDHMIEITGSDAVAFRSIEPSIDAVAAIITFNLLHKDCVRKQKIAPKKKKN